jgi:hypothetical protein
MARTRTGEQIIDDAYLRADLVGATDRHPRTTVLRYANQGGAELWDKIVAARGRAFCATKPPQSITTTASTSRYALATAFYQLSAVRLDGTGGYCLLPFETQDEPMLREPSLTAQYPTHYQLQPGYIELLPLHSAGSTIKVDYVPHFTDLTDSSGSTFDGINGWESYLSVYSAREMFRHDGEKQDAAECTAELAALSARIAGLAPKRDAFRAERVKNVRRIGGLGRW